MANGYCEKHHAFYDPALWFPMCEIEKQEQEQDDKEMEEIA